LNDKISEKDRQDWDNFISNKEKLPNKDINLKKVKNQKIKSLDLHGYTLDQANKKIKEFIIENYNKEVNKLIIVTGKGLRSKNESNPYVSKDLSILKYSVPEYIKNNKSIMKHIYEIREAKIEDGGSGAFYIYLKNKKNYSTT
jgi:DNA-nicking Smr family endonuclease